MLTILSVIGTRPETTKMAPVFMELKKHRDRVQSLVCVTELHRQMLDQVLTLFDIQAEQDLTNMKPGQALSQWAANLFSRLDLVVEERKPIWMVARGAARRRS